MATDNRDTVRAFTRNQNVKPAPADVAPAPRVLIARQPIVDRNLALHGYEILFRGARGSGSDPERWTASLIVDGLAEVGLPALVGDALAYINVSRGFLLEVDPLPFDPAGVVLELTEDSHQTDDVLLRRLDALRAAGFRIALDDFAFDPSLAPLIEHADVVKLDVMADGLARTAEVVAALRPYGLELLAEKVETAEEFDFCRRLCFHTFQGYFFARPRDIAGTGVSADRLASLSTLAQLNDPALDLEDLEQLIANDVGLTYKLLRYVNSGFFSRSREIETVHDALVLLGQSNVRQWATVMTLAGATARPPALIALALLRARLCETSATERGGVCSNAAFLAGLLSVLDALLDVPMHEAVARLPLTDELSAALLDREGPLGQLLERVTAIEEGSLELLDEIGSERYAQASAWAEGVMLAAN